MSYSTSYSSSCRSPPPPSSLASIKSRFQNGDILVPANPVPPGKWPLEWRGSLLLFVGGDDLPGALHDL